MNTRWVVILALLVMISPLAGQPAALADGPPSERQFEGVTVNLLTSGPGAAYVPLRRHVREFGRITGARIIVNASYCDSMYHDILADVALGANVHQTYVFGSQWAADYVADAILEDLTERVKADQAIQWDDIAPLYRNLTSVYNGRIHTIPLDGDYLMVYYRKDMLDRDGLTAPETWEDYLAIARHFHRQDLNADSLPDYGSCIAKGAGVAFQHAWAFVAPFLQTQGTTQGGFFDVTTMEPLVDNDGWRTAMEIFRETGKYGPPAEIYHRQVDARALFISGRCALLMDWGNTGPLAVGMSMSKVRDKVGAVMLPGTREVVDFTTKKLVPCDGITCPYAINGVNHAPYASFDGWSGAINAAADPRVKDAAYAFLSYISQPAQSNIDVTIGATGFNPYRRSQIASLDPWLRAGFSETAAKDYLAAIEASLNSPNIVLDLRVPQSRSYLEEVLDEALRPAYLNGMTTVEVLQQQVYDGWERLTTELGRDRQLAAYRASLGVAAR